MTYFNFIYKSRKATTEETSPDASALRPQNIRALQQSFSGRHSLTWYFSPF